MGCRAVRHKTGSAIEFRPDVVTLEAQQWQVGCYGFGWDVASRDGHRVVAHDGAWQGFTMSIARYLDDRLTVIVMTNLDSDNAKPGQIVKEVADAYLK